MGLSVEALLGGSVESVAATVPAHPLKQAHATRHAERAHEGALLRSGSALARLQRLRRLLDRAAPGAPWPRLRDIAAITGLQVETVSRLLSRERGRIVASCS
ncbi:helix-turn-helix domain-containing protein [Hydrogenophilus thermoluteolus]|uniref:Transcriptional regulator n=1 Tax=Hydrogenophilus thermoluteolus TaxID=297 RepID=A0A2Z6E085_HYDTE|nr:hypothetical protein [Hydrogenophilus thermoluteolus]BBD78194.1 transcriptional regulator [Hydrogenophilus thermoluteolus]